MNSDRAIVEQFIINHTTDAVRIIERLDIDEISTFLIEMPKNISAAVLKNLEPYSAVKCFENMGAATTASLIESFPLPIIMNLLRLTQRELKHEILGHLDNELSALIKKKLQYQEGSAGALADPFVFTLPEDFSIKQALEMIKKRNEAVIYYIFILNRDHVLTGVIDLRDIMFSNPTVLISDVMQTQLIKISAQLSSQDILEHPGWKNFPTLPVVEKTGVFMGVLRYESIHQIEKEHSKIQVSKRLVDASNALGELFQIGLTGLMRSANQVIKEYPEKNPNRHS